MAGDFFEYEIRRKTIFYFDQKSKNRHWAKIVQKYIFMTYAILTFEVSNENDCKLDKIRNF